jgi:hypothetical protein
MNTINIPGFTAEASLYTAGERYRMAHFSLSVGEGGIVRPQFCFTDDDGRTICCESFGDFFSCSRGNPHSEF